MKLATLLNTSYENVDLFTVLHHNDNTSLLDVRFSAHGSPYYAPEKINTKVGMSYKEVCLFISLKQFVNTKLIALYFKTDWRRTRFKYIYDKYWWMYGRES